MKVDLYIDGSFWKAYDVREGTLNHIFVPITTYRGNRMALEFVRENPEDSEAYLLGFAYNANQ